MPSLQQIEDLLNRNPDFQAAFLRDPIGTLAQRGLFLSIRNQHELRESAAYVLARGPVRQAGPIRGIIGPNDKNQASNRINGNQGLSVATKTCTIRLVLLVQSSL